MSSVEETRFKVGQKVRLVKQFTGDPGWIMDDMPRVLASGEVGEVLNDHHPLHFKVSFPSIKDTWHYPASSLAPADAPRIPKGGDRAKVKNGAVTQSKYYGKVGKIERTENYGDTGGDWQIECTLRFDDGETQYAYWPAHIELLPPDPITLNGKAYTVQEGEGGVLTLTPVPLWEPKQGEIGRDKDGDLFLVTNEDEDDAPPLTVYLTGPVGETGTADPEDGDVMAFPTLKAAIAAGAL